MDALLAEPTEGHAAGDLSQQSQPGALVVLVEVQRVCLKVEQNPQQVQDAADNVSLIKPSCWCYSASTAGSVQGWDCRGAVPKGTNPH